MKRGVFIGLIVLMPLLAIANDGGGKQFSAEATLSTFLAASHDKVELLQAFEGYIRKIDRKRPSFKSSHEFTRYIFIKAHDRFLRQYVAQATLDETFSSGSYNCLTGTILLSLTLTHYNIEHTVIETNYHIFILAETDSGQVLLEATDPLNGFETEKIDIEKRVALYKKNELQDEQPRKPHYRFRVELFNEVSLHQLRGLTHYNNAVNFFNQKNLELAVKQLIAANDLYASHRIDEFSQILLLALQQSELDTKTKENCLQAILSLRQKSLPMIIASN